MDHSRKQLRRATIVFWILFLYIIAALLWWLLSLEQQNKAIHEGLRKELRLQGKGEQSPEWKTVGSEQQRASTKYVLEGITFLLLVVVGAVYIYRLVRRQFSLQQQQRNFVMAVTHELKTPISIARLNLETMQKHQLDEEKRKKLVATTVEETMRLDTLINNILISTQLDVDAYKAAEEELDFSGLVDDVLNGFRSRYPGRKVEQYVEEDIEIKGDPLLLKLLLSNLLENAHKYSDKGTTITCRVTVVKGIRLCVSDEGAGIPEDEKKKVFEKFYRIGNEQTRTTQGTGLGLYICKKIVQSHGGTISVGDNDGRGSTFTVTFHV